MEWVNYIYFPCENALRPSALARAAQSVGFALEDPNTGRIRAARMKPRTLDFDTFDVANLAELDAQGLEPNLAITIYHDDGPLQLHIDPRRVISASFTEPEGLADLPCLGHIWFNLGVMWMSQPPDVSRFPEMLIQLYATLCRQTGAVYGFSTSEIELELGPGPVAALRAIQAGRAPDGLYWMTYFGRALAERLDFAPLRSLGALAESVDGGVLVRLTEHPKDDVSVDPRRIYAEWQKLGLGGRHAS